MKNIRYLDTNQVDAGILVKNQTKAAPFMFLTATTAQSTPHFSSQPFTPLLYHPSALFL